MYRIQEMTDNYQLLNDIEKWNKAEIKSQQDVRVKRSEKYTCKTRYRTPIGYVYQVQGTALYSLRFVDNNLVCSCPDYSNRHSTCKHGYAVLRSLDYSSLLEYLEIKAIAKGKEERCFEGKTYKL